MLSRHALNRSIYFIKFFCPEADAKVSVQAVPQVVDWPSGDDVHVIRVACGARHTVTLLGEN